LRGGPRKRLKQFAAGLRAAAHEVKKKNNKVPDGMERYATLFQQNYNIVLTYKQAKKAYARLKQKAAQGEWIASDIETDSGLVLMYGFCPKPGEAYCFVLDHPENRDNKDKRKLFKLVKKLLRDKRIKKTFHHGCSDVSESKALMGVDTKGFEIDTEHAAYFFDSDMKKYGLTAIADRWFPEFSGYKEITMPEALPKGVDYKKGRSAGMLHYGQVPIKKLALYNCADVDMGKRIELKVKKHVSIPLLKVYRDVSFIIDKMEDDGPYLDYEHHALLEKIYPIRKSRWLRKLKKLVGDEKFNPRSPKRVIELLYKTYKFEAPTVWKRGQEVQDKNSRQGTLEYIAAHTKHKFPSYMLEFRAADTICTKALKSYKNSADLHEGKLRTNWWLTGTITGRLRSGGKKEDAKDFGKQLGIINLQNIDSNPVVQNLAISDIHWRKLFKSWHEHTYKPFQHHDKKWEKLFELDAKTKEPTPASVHRLERFFQFAEAKSNFDWEDFGDLEIFLSCDYSQIEVRVLAQMSGEPVMLDAFERGIDIHAAVGADLTGWPVERIMHDKDMRRKIKTIHFAIIYGKKLRGLYQQLVSEGVKVTMNEVKELLDKYWRKYKRNAELCWTASRSRLTNMTT
jgi:DNA polymerase I-like protein with 3'-5' exonuclease and polymerase domains